MYPHPPQPCPLPSPDQVPTPGSVKTVAVMIWLTVALALLILTLNMVMAPRVGVSPGYAFGSAFHFLLIAALLAVTAIPVVRGKSWARTMAKVVLIIQIVLQSLSIVSETYFLWALILLPMAITALIQLLHPTAKWFFTVHNPAANLKYLQQFTAAYYAQQSYPGHYPPQQYPPQVYRQQPPHPQPQPHPWNPNPHQQ